MVTLPICAEMRTRETALAPCGLMHASNIPQFPSVWVRCLIRLSASDTCGLSGLLYLFGQKWYFIHIILEHVLLTIYNLRVIETNVNIEQLQNIPWSG